MKPADLPFAHGDTEFSTYPELRGKFPRALRQLEKGIGLTIEAATAVLIVAEICILFAGVISRYFLNSPIVWTDEAASIVFLWLASLGAVVAFRRSEHMRMTALVSARAPQTRVFFDTFAVAAGLVFLAEIQTDFPL